MKVIALTFGNESCASTHFRIVQYCEALARRGIQIEHQPADEFSDWPSLKEFDVVILQKRLFGGGVVRRLRKHARRLVYDIDDAIWLPHGKRHHWITRWRTERRLRNVVTQADLCLVANDQIRRKLADCGGQAVVLPMALAEADWMPPDRVAGPKVRLGWAGSPANLGYLKMIEADLAQVLAAHPHIELAVFCGARPEFDRDLPFTYLPFEAGREAEVVRSFDIGLLPLPGDSFSAYKSPIKALQYMACGAATVASPVGATEEMLEDGHTGLFAGRAGDWFDPISRLATDSALRTGIQQAARAQFEEYYSLERTADAFARHLRALAD